MEKAREKPRLFHGQCLIQGVAAPPPPPKAAIGHNDSLNNIKVDTQPVGYLHKLANFLRRFMDRSHGQPRYLHRSKPNQVPSDPDRGPSGAKRYYRRTFGSPPPDSPYQERSKRVRGNSDDAGRPAGEPRFHAPELDQSTYGSDDDDDVKSPTTRPGPSFPATEFEPLTQVDRPETNYEETTEYPLSFVATDDDFNDLMLRTGKKLQNVASDLTSNWLHYKGSGMAPLE